MVLWGFKGTFSWFLRILKEGRASPGRKRVLRTSSLLSLHLHGCIHRQLDQPAALRISYTTFYVLCSLPRPLISLGASQQLHHTILHYTASHCVAYSSPPPVSVSLLVHPEHHAASHQKCSIVQRHYYATSCSTLYMQCILHYALYKDMLRTV